MQAGGLLDLASAPMIIELQPGVNLFNVGKVFVDTTLAGTINPLIILNNVAEWPISSSYTSPWGLFLDGSFGCPTRW
jgi:hypothetical protein